MSKSLRLQVMLTVAAAILLIWGGSSAVAWLQVRHEIDELFDTQQIQFARQLLAADLHDFDEDGARLPRGKALLPKQLPKGQRGNLEDDALSFIVWDDEGRVVFSDGEDQGFAPPDGQHGFYNVSLDGDNWRVLYLPMPDGHRIAAVGQQLSFRNEVAREILLAQLLPWLLALPLLLLVLWLTLTRRLLPFRRVAEQLHSRQLDDATPVDADVPAEAAPMLLALNRLIGRMADTLSRERRFTADAAHELRTPLAALKIQAEVAQLGLPAAEQARALAQLEVGVDRASRLVNQLLALTRLDPMAGPQNAQAVNWQRVLQHVLDDAAGYAAERGVSLSLSGDPAHALPLQGDETLLTLMLRNLADNAIRYSQAGGEVVLLAGANAITVQDRGPGIAPELMPRIRERFFRPPGQEQLGSGLGLSIVERVAELHGLRLELENRAEGGLAACIKPA
ncbi:ATP-binding protein [Craterilacuibacter sp. RT1T]|uniref:ATP-binding protein n=1 Tax=Craterilacuibacter sp. RT1T TaxID=2942211 RepID=UPI0020BF6D4E|nr:ATP-binding protein [Craterilacuibacter sp. RT1T]